MKSAISSGYQSLGQNSDAAPKPTTDVEPERPHRSAASKIPSTASQLERLARSATQVVNGGDFDHETPAGREFASYVSDDFQAVLDNYSPEPLSWRGLCATWKLMARLDPSVFFDIRQISSDVDDVRGKATVYVEIAATGVTGSKDVKFLTMSVLSWRRDEKGRWWYHRYQGMLGTVGSGGFV